MHGQLEAGGARRFIHRWQSTGPAPVPGERPPIPWEFGGGSFMEWDDIFALLYSPTYAETSTNILTQYCNGFLIGGEVFAMAWAFGDSMAWDADNPTSYDLGAMTPDAVLSLPTKYYGDQVGSVYKLRSDWRTPTTWTRTVAANVSMAVAIGTDPADPRNHTTKTIPLTGDTAQHARELYAPIVLPVYDVYAVWVTGTAPGQVAYHDVYDSLYSLAGKYKTGCWMPSGLEYSAYIDTKAMYGWANGNKLSSTDIWESYDSSVIHPRSRSMPTNFYISTDAAEGRPWQNPCNLEMPYSKYYTRTSYGGFSTVAGGYYRGGKKQEYVDFKNKYVYIFYVLKQLWPTRKTPLCEV